MCSPYWPNGALKSLNCVAGLPYVIFGNSDGSGLDGEGRVQQIWSQSGHSPLTGVTYNNGVSGQVPTQPIGSAAIVTYGSGDFDNFSYDVNNSWLTGYQYNVGSPSQAVIGTLTWNQNGTLQQSKVTADPFNSANVQTCNYGYDDLARIASANCGNTIWTQNFGFDVFGNITKTVPTGGTGISFQAGYDNKNRISSLPGVTPSYDNDGNLTADGTHTYAWDYEGRVIGIDSVTLTYDALNRAVEQNRSGSYTQIVYDPLGRKLALTSNYQTLIKGFIYLPGGGTAVYLPGAAPSYYRHPDWLGSSRLTTTQPQTSSPPYDVAYAPYGEPYNGSGTTPDLNFTGQNQDTVAGLYDFMFREYPPVQGRWVSPDPAGLAAVDMTNPQTWNRYGYVGNRPTISVDPLGLADCYWDGNILVCKLYEWGSGGPLPPWQYGGGTSISDVCDTYYGYVSFRNCRDVPDQPTAPQKPKKAANNGKGHGCVGTRIAKGVQGVVNIGLGELKTAGAIGVGLLGAGGAPETGGASLSATLGAGYLAISSQGQVLSGQGQLYSAISGNFQTGEQIQQVGDIMSGPISGITTLIVTKNPEAAALAANVESAITLGAGAFNSETVADKIANGVDAALTFFGIGQGNCQVP